jgi:2-dehydro-3-deoxygluconokinase
VAFAGPAEAALFVDPADALGEMAKLGPAEVVIKDGARGCEALIDGSLHRVAALPVTVVDPVGAGDAFVAGYLAERMAGADPAARLATAIAAGAFAVTVPGDCEGLPDRDELAALGGDDLRR